MSVPDIEEHEDGEDRPWEVPGQCRRDCAPHRAEFLSGLAKVSAFLAILSFLLVPSFFALALAISVWCMARRDLRVMSSGLMDVAGFSKTAHAREIARFAVAWSILSCG